MKNSGLIKRRLPAEWEEQDAIMIAIPNKNTDWAKILDEVLNVYKELINTIGKYEKLLIITDNIEKTKKMIADDDIFSNCLFIKTQYNDTWTRDYGFITIIENGRRKVLDFTFNGWGLKFASNFDNQVNRFLKLNNIFNSKVKFKTYNFVLEGGSIESDGNGTILTTSKCLLSPNRNPQFDQEKIEKRLEKYLGAEKVLFLRHGFLIGDDTDSHIDTLARLCPNNTILYISCKDKKDEHYTELKLMEKELINFRNAKNKPFNLIPLPFPSPKFDEEGNRLPATYANFLITNKQVIVPVYDDPEDDNALDIIKSVFKDREIKAINALPLIKQHGSIHCITMQIPSGTLKWKF